ncbi:hypothetical protein [Polyangium mundeleinium]|uniref:Calcineurin-like phosphoesterase domain-containing protein n=1 Tax=Polyangium mundeleinium TaxID=2995306 RepID=A0ABT5F4N3_9BACT|nr:hypothetical protein [Polyangium mundeleinium]MDC0749044.1 hypothetical protein [Polyangium mundeleinium]
MPRGSPCRVACVGDIVDGKGDLERVIERLCEHPGVAVRGNHEPPTPFEMP